MRPTKSYLSEQAVNMPVMPAEDTVTNQAFDPLTSATIDALHPWRMT
jgi:hypothetical protein